MTIDDTSSHKRVLLPLSRETRILQHASRKRRGLGFNGLLHTPVRVNQTRVELFVAEGHFCPLCVGGVRS